MSIRVLASTPESAHTAARWVPAASVPASGGLEQRDLGDHEGVALAGARNATHLGLSTSTDSDVAVDLGTPPLIGVPFDDTITAANGADLHTTATATIDITPIFTGGLAPVQRRRDDHRRDRALRRSQ